MLAGVGVCALPNANRRHAHRLEPAGRKGSPSSLPSENRKQKLVFDQAACTSILEGTRLINGTLERTFDGDVGETSDREVIFNLGSYKTGSTSLNEALGLLGYRACKTAWGELGGQYASFDMTSIAAFKASPLKGDLPLHKAVQKCDALGDAPWLFLFPTLMQKFPKAKFILTRQPTCEDWVYHVRGLWQWMGWLGKEQNWTTALGKKNGLAGELNKCWYGSWAPSPDEQSTRLWHDRCVETERAIVRTAKVLNRSLLVLPSTWSDREKWAALNGFLGTDSAALECGQPDYPYHSTGELHNPDEAVPEKPVDVNAHLWPKAPELRDERSEPLHPELTTQMGLPCTTIAVGRLASLSGIALWCYELAEDKEACDKLHLTLDTGRYVKCIWREQCTAEAVVEGAPPCTEATVNTPRLSQSAKLATPPLARGEPLQNGFTIATKDIWKMYECPDGAQELPMQRDWLASLGGTTFESYLKRVYGQNISNVPATTLSFFWDTVPHRWEIKAVWSPWFCSKTKPATQPPGQLWAPLDDPINSPTSVHVKDLKSCAALARAHDNAWGKAPSFFAAGTDEKEPCEAALCALGMTEVAESSCKLSYPLVRCSDRRWHNKGDDYTFRNCVASNAMSRAPEAPLYFPGFFVRHSADFFVREALRVAPSPAPGQNKDKITDTGVGHDTWVEVVRIGRLDDKQNAPDRATAGQVWFWLASGSGIWWNTGRTLVINDGSAGAGCAVAHAKGYQSVQLTRRGPTPTHPYSYEIVDCRLQGTPVANMTWASACPPPGVPLRSGVPAEDKRYAPALTGKGLRTTSRHCHCDPQYNYLNCAGA